MEPSLISVTGSLGLVMSVCSSRISTMRWAEARLMVIIMNTMETIIRLDRIWIT